jgi:hypothetical protein
VGSDDDGAVVAVQREKFDAAGAEFGGGLEAGFRVVGEAVVHQLGGHGFDVVPEFFRAREGGEQAVALALEPMPSGPLVHPTGQRPIEPPLGPCLDRGLGGSGELAGWAAGRGGEGIIYPETKKTLETRAFRRF